ncbi:MAG TPA: sugar-binding protein, partial [Sedimentisphaerales bacterium]|nr:sugar-binding protein [Sedimentisphaerales bacterium]
MCRKLFLLTSFVVVLGLTGSASAQLIAYEPFDYPANGLSGNDGGSGWNGAWDGGDQQVTAPGLAFSPLLVKGNKATVVGNETESFRDLPEPMGDNETQLWISFVGQADQQPGAAMWGGVSFHEPDESLFLGVPWQDGEGDKVWGLDTKGDENRFTEIPITEKIIFVARVDFNTDGDNDTVTAWAKSINDTDPLDLTDETAFAQYTTRNIEFSRVRIAGNQPVNIDEIRLSMTPPIEPVDMEIGFAAQPPVLDGEVDEIWADASTQYFVPLDDPANASGSWMALYDSENLYVIVDMTDDSLQNDSASSWQDDSVEVYFDGGNTKVNTPLSGDDHQYTFGWTTDDIQGNNFEGYIEGMEHAQVTTDTGWRIEIKMPWLSIQGAAPQAGDLIGIDCYYNDDDDGGDSRENKLLSFSAVEGWNDA